MKNLYMMVTIATKLISGLSSKMYKSDKDVIVWIESVAFTKNVSS